MVHLKENTVEGYAEYVLNQESGVYDKVSVDAFNEALLLFTGKFSFGEEKEITEKVYPSWMDFLQNQILYVRPLRLRRTLNRRRRRRQH